MKTNRIFHLFAIGTLASLVACGVSEPQVDPEINGKADNVDCANVDEITFDCPAELPSMATIIKDGIILPNPDPPAGTDDNLPSVHSDLVQYQSSVKSQGRRGVCSIFANVGFMEHLYIKARAKYEADPELAARFPDDFSEQYLQWAVKFTGGGSFPDSSGSNAYYNLRAITNHGIPVEAAWKYEPNQWNADDDEACTGEDDQPTHCYTNGHPEDAVKDGPKYILAPSSRLSARRIKSHINNNKTGVVLGLKFFYQSWNHRKTNLEPNKASWNQGIVLYPNQADYDDSTAEGRGAGHGILIVGWDDTLKVPTVDGEGKHTCTAPNSLTTSKIDAGTQCPEGHTIDSEKGFYIFKNSWGTGNFGKDNEYGDGYGFISKKYIHEYASCRVSRLPRPSDLPEIEIEPEPEPEPEGESRTFNGELEQGAYSEVQTFDIGDDAKNVKVVMSGTGDPDLYVSFGDEGINREELSSSSVTCRPYKNGAEETCDSELASVTKSTLVVFVHGFKKSTYKVMITWDKE